LCCFGGRCGVVGVIGSVVCIPLVSVQDAAVVVAVNAAAPVVVVYVLFLLLLMAVVWLL